MSETKITRNPFEEVNAVNLDDDQILDYWIKPDRMFEKHVGGVHITDGLSPIFLFGGRGTGKTTVLKYLSFEIQEKEFIMIKRSDLSRFLGDDRDFLGVYYRFDGPQLAAFNFGQPDYQCLEIFRMFIELVLSQRYLWMIEELITKGAIKKFDEKLLCKNICITVFGQEIPSLETISSIRENLASNQFQLEKYRDEVALAENSILPSVIPRGRLIFELPNVCKNAIRELQNMKILYLFDEYENLTVQQQMLINTLIKHRKYNMTFRIGCRLEGIKTYATLSEEEYLKKNDDFRSLIFEDVLRTTKSSYRDLLIGIAEKRLLHNEEFKKYGITNIEKILGESPSMEHEAAMILAESDDKTRHLTYNGVKYGQKKSIDRIFDSISCPGQPLIEKLNLMLLHRNYPPSKIHSMMNSFIKKERKSILYKQYANLYEKNKMTLLFQLISDYRPRQKLYVGFDVYATLSSGIIRNFLELCYHAFNLALFNEKDSLLRGNPISVKNQKEAAYLLSEKYYTDIDSITGGFGHKITILVDNVGSILRGLHKDPLISEPEPTYFTTEYVNLDAETKEIMDTATKWSVFQKTKSMKTKAKAQAHLVDFVINRLLCPKFSISYRKRGRTMIVPKDLHKLILGNEEEQRQVREKISKIKESNREKNLRNQGQPKLVDFFD